MRAAEGKSIPWIINLSTSLGPTLQKNLYLNGVLAIQFIGNTMIENEDNHKKLIKNRAESILYIQ